MKKSEFILKEYSEAKYFTEAYPIGNGTLGGMVYSNKSGRISLNHDKLWCGHRMEEAHRFNKEDYFKARDLALEGKYLESERLITEKISRYSVSSYAPLGDLYIEVGEGEHTDLVRTLDISRAVANTTYTVDGAKVEATTIASEPDMVIAQNVVSDKKINARVRLTTPHNAEYSCFDDMLSFGARVAGTSKGQRIPGRSPESYLEGEDKGALVYAKAKIITDGVCKRGDGFIEVCDFTALTVYLSASTSYKDGCEEGNPNYKQDVEDVIAKISKQNFANILENHIKDYKNYFDRCEVHIDGDDVDEAKSTTERFNDFRLGKADYALITLVFNFGKYLLISGSREGTAPTNLQGIWNESMTPPWASDYHLNINTQMNYWPALYLGLPELIEPLEWLLEIASKMGKPIAENVFGARGFCVSHNLDVYGTAYPTPGSASWSYFPVAAGWLARELYNKYEYTLDKEYLKKEYHIFYGIAEFFMDMLVDDGEGYLISAPAASPENLHLINGEECSIGKSSTMTASIIRESLDNFIKASEILGIDDELVRGVKAAFPRLLPLRITEDGRIEEWYFGNNAPLPIEAEPTHRHLSHLYDLYPGNRINDDTPELLMAAKKTLEVRGDDATGWSLGWKMNCKARLGDGEGIMNLIKMFFRYVSPEETNTLAGGGIYTNLFCAHPPFQIDGNYGFTAGICEMLVGQKPNGEVKLLPALPSELKSGCAKGICIKGDKKVDLAWKNGKITDYKIY